MKGKGERDMKTVSIMKFGKRKNHILSIGSEIWTRDRSRSNLCCSVLHRNSIQKHEDTVPCSVKNSRNTVKTIAARNRNQYRNYVNCFPFISCQIQLLFQSCNRFDVWRPNLLSEFRAVAALMNIVKLSHLYESHCFAMKASWYLPSYLFDLFAHSTSIEYFTLTILGRYSIRRNSCSRKKVF